MSKKLQTLFKKLKRFGYKINFKSKIVDPVCNMKIEPGIFSSEQGGNTYYFCSEYCKTQFDADPEQFANQ